jgi:valyl-tRNA synthetase
MSQSETETRWIDAWEAQGVYRWDPKIARDASYVIDTPPPTVSGFLHIGHVFSYTQTDFIARFQRLRGMNVFYPMGFDDNGLPTERLVEKLKNVRAVDMQREEFVALCHDVVQESENEFRALFKRIALSVDWTTEYQTISPLAWKISQMSLLDLFEKNHLERKPQPTLWDPADRTALAQAEVVEKEVQGVIYTLPFERENGTAIEIATTRPELLAACVALLCHPEDPRAGDLVGSTVYSPLFGVPVPVLADEKVDPTKGTGVVMCCTFGDLTDIEWWRTHSLPLRDIVGKDGRIFGLERIGSEGWPTRDAAGAAEAARYITGLNVRKAREAIVTLLREKELIRGEQSVVQMVPSAERSGAPLEILVTAQWFVKLLDKKEALIAKGRAMDWYPAFMEQRFEDWVSNLKWDWCISRQRFFGVPLPFWYSKRAGEVGKVLVPHVDDLPVNPLVSAPRGYTMDEVEPDPDVMDTWATSSVSPQINAQGITPEKNLDPARYQALFPADLRPQAHEIIRTWAFYTVAKALLHTDQTPFATMALSGWCLANDNTKMSKSKGNIVQPQKLLNQYGTDVVRYWTATARLGRDTAFSEDVLKVGKRLVTKLTNAAKFVALHIAAVEGEGLPAAANIMDGRITHQLDLWLISRLSQVIEQVTNHFMAYDYTDALEITERFFFSDFCDNYLELVKGRVYGEIGSEADKLSGQLTLAHGLFAILRLFAPFLPFTTEQIFSDVFPKTTKLRGSIHQKGFWPKADNWPRDALALKEGAACLDILAIVRAAKTAKGVSIKAPIEYLGIHAAPADQLIDPSILTDLAHTVSAAKICLLPAVDKTRYSLTINMAATPATVS